MQRIADQINGSTATTYYWAGSNISHMTSGSDTLHFWYDAAGLPTMVTYNGTNYYYKHNLQGDIIGLMDAAGSQVVAYTYDSWGKQLTCTGTLANTLGVANPLRYRGYIYDSETGLYYLQSRYYDPDWGRFVNADAEVGQIGNIQGNNIFAYCFNNPIMLSDSSGHWPSLSSILTAVAVVSIVIAVAAVCLATFGAASPAFALAGGGILTGSAGGFVAEATTVATIAAKTAVIASGSAVVAKEIEDKLRPENTVYKLVNPSTNEVEYVGRTKDPAARKTAHATDPNRAGLKFEVIKSGLNYYQARGFEQAGMLFYHTINTTNKMNNQINGISSKNKMLGVYMEAGKGIATYLGNQVSNEILCWAGQ